MPRDSKGACDCLRRHPAIPLAPDSRSRKGATSWINVSYRAEVSYRAARRWPVWRCSARRCRRWRQSARLQRSTRSGRRPVALSFPTRPGEAVLPWLDQPGPNPVPDIAGNLLTWEALDSWITPNDAFFTIKHYAQPTIDATTWRLGVHGLVAHPLTLSLADLQARPHQEVAFTIECSGNHGFGWNFGLIGNADLDRHATRGAAPGRRSVARRQRSRLLGHRDRSRGGQGLPDSPNSSRAACRWPRRWIRATSSAGA